MDQSSCTGEVLSLSFQSYTSGPRGPVLKTNLKQKCSMFIGQMDTTFLGFFFFLIRPMSHSVLPECSHFWYLPQWLWPLPLVAGIAAYQAAQSQTAVPQFSWFPQRRNPRRVLGGVDEAHVCLQFALDEIIYILNSLCQRLRQSVSPAILFSVVV